MYHKRSSEVVVFTADLIVEARRRAGLTQEQLADRLGRPRPTVARWETGRHVPSMATVREIAHACDPELTYGLANYDDSYRSLIDRQLGLTPVERLAEWSQRSVGVFSSEEEIDARAIFNALDAAKVGYVLVGQLAGALHGSPIAGARHLELVPDPDDTNTRALGCALVELGANEQAPREPWGPELHPWQPWRLSDATHVVVSPRPAATHGYDDLARDAETLELDGELDVTVASLRDLARIADATPRR